MKISRFWGDFHRFSVAMFDYQRVRFLMYVIVYIKWLLQMTSQCWKRCSMCLFGASTSTMPSCWPLSHLGVSENYVEKKHCNSNKYVAIIIAGWCWYTPTVRRDPFVVASWMFSAANTRPGSVSEGVIHRIGVCCDVWHGQLDNKNMGSAQLLFLLHLVDVFNLR